MEKHGSAPAKRCPDSHHQGKQKMNSLLKTRLAGCAASLVFLLSACGGGTGDSSVSERSTVQQADVSTGAPLSTDALLAQGAKLNTAALKEAESEAIAADQLGTPSDLDQLAPDELAPKSAYASGAVRRKTADKLVPVWRFYNSATGAHFFTRSASERDNVIANLSPPKGSFQYEGEAFKVANAPSPGLSPVHRFYNTQTGVHFYTISDTERTHITTNLPQFAYEGIAYYASKVNGGGMTPFYRFYLPGKGFHFYTASQQERDNITANLAAIYQYEGAGYSVLDSDWQPEPEPPAVLPHSGAPNTRCFVENHYQFTHQPCLGADAIALNPQQDGHRVAINPMSFSTLGAYPLTNCVKDNVTGLVWEGKTADGGPRDQFQQFSNLGNGKTNDSSGYITYVNGSKLCGYSDWRLPTLQELLGIVDYGQHQPSLNRDWFPNWASDSITYWTSDIFSGNSAFSATVTFSTGWANAFGRSSNEHIRLVRGYGHTTSRFSYGSVAYGDDAANNLVIDGWTGLQWRRCEQGKTWDGTTCTGAAASFNHPQALNHARDLTGWRLPNVKELSSLLIFGLPRNAAIDPTAFPGTSAGSFWSSTPNPLATTFAHHVNFSNAAVNNAYRFQNYFNVRLVRAAP